MQLSSLCENYWRPIYSYLRRSGYTSADAEDLTQGFFEHLLGRDWLRNVQPENGKFRTFLLKCLKNYCQNIREKALAQKRGGNKILIPIEEVGREEEQFLHSPNLLPPEHDFDRAWAESLMQRSINRLRNEYLESGKGELYDALKTVDLHERSGRTYAQIGQKVGLSEDGVKSAVRRMRARLANILRMEIQATVSDPAQCDEELKFLREVLSR